MIASKTEYLKLFGNIVPVGVMSMARYACVACNSCTCVGCMCNCRCSCDGGRLSEFKWEVI